MRIVNLGRGLFALSFAGLAIFAVAYGHAAVLGVPLPKSIPGREIWIYASALLIFGAAIGLCFSRTALPSALTIAACQAVGTLLCVPPIFAKPLGVDAWYGFCEALTLLIGAWILYSQLRWQARGLAAPISAERAVRAAQILFGLTCVFYGWSHFLYDDYTASMVPTWLPARLPLAYLTGIGHIAAGVGIIFGIFPRLAATLEAIMMSLFGLLVWVPSFWAQPRPSWATPPQNQWSELIVTGLVTASAWIIASSLRNRPWGFAPRRNLAAQQTG